MPATHSQPCSIDAVYVHDTSCLSFDSRKGIIRLKETLQMTRRIAEDCITLPSHKQPNSWQPYEHYVVV